MIYGVALREETGGKVDKRTEGAIATITEGTLGDEEKTKADLRLAGDEALHSMDGLQLVLREHGGPVQIARDDRGKLRVYIHRCDPSAFDQLAAVFPEAYWQSKDSEARGLSILAEVELFPGGSY